MKLITFEDKSYAVDAKITCEFIVRFINTVRPELSVSFFEDEEGEYEWVHVEGCCIATAEKGGEAECRSMISWSDLILIEP